MKANLPNFLAAALAALAMAAVSRADILVYEPFAYSLADETPLTGTPVTATGLSGKYSASIKTNTFAGSDGTGSAHFSAVGLGFERNFHPVSGGAAVISATAGSAQNGMPTTETLLAKLSGAPSPPFYCSFLFKFAADFPTNNNGSTFVGLKVGDLVIAPNWNDKFTNVAGIGLGAPEGVLTRFDPFAETVFLAVAKAFKNEAGLMQATLWIFDQSSFEAWCKDGAKEEGLSKFAQVQTASSPKSGNVNLGESCKFEVFSGNFASHNITMTVDELVVGTTLADVTTGSAPKK
ncbi:MAG: hypothetical protein WC003_04330 [Terrimicrobiaceae bacterium]